MDCTRCKTIFDGVCFGTIQIDGITAENCWRHGSDGGKKVGRSVLTQGLSRLREEPTEDGESEDSHVGEEDLICNDGT